MKESEEIGKRDLLVGWEVMSDLPVVFWVCTLPVGYSGDWNCAFVLYYSYNSIIQD
jgi:hypothetical protein